MKHPTYISMDVEPDKPKEYKFEPIHESCPHCENEVALQDVFVPQPCPECHKIILPCTICTAENCGSCPLESVANTMRIKGRHMDRFNRKWGSGKTLEEWTEEL